MTTTVTAQIQLRKGTAAQWTSVNPILASGEIGYETDTLKQKIGDGTTAWTALAYYHDPDGITDHGALTGLSDDDHGQYHTDARGDARYSLLSHDHDADYEPAGAISTHESAVNPHPGYLTPVEGDAAYSALSHNHSGIYEPAGSVATHASGSGVHSIAGVTGLQTALDSKSATSHDHAATYAPIAKGVTNGDSHDHVGGDGAQIAYSGLSGLPTLGTAAAQNTGAFEAAGAVSTHAAITTTHGISSFGASLVDDADAGTARTTLGLGTAATTASTDYATSAHNHSGTYEPAATVEISAALADDDTVPIYDTSATAQKKSLVSRIWTYIAAKLTSYAGDLTAKSFSLSGNISAAAWTTAGIRHKNVAATLTDTSSSGTVATAYTNVLGGNTIAASNTVTFTNYATMYLAAPVSGTNVTITNAFSLITEGPIKIGSLNAVTGNGILSVVSLTQAAYDALTPKVATTLYIVNG